MPYDRKSDDLDLATDPLPTSVWVHVARLLGLPPKARPDFERLWFAHRWLVAFDRETYELALGGWAFIVEAEERWGLIESDDPPFRQQFSKEDVKRARELWKLAVERVERVRKEPPRSRLLVLALRDIIVHYTGKRPHHGDKWLDPLTKICQEIDPAITKWQVRDALHPRRRRST